MAAVTLQPVAADHRLITHRHPHADCWTEAGPDSAGQAWLGADAEVHDGRLVVTGVLRDTPAYGSGLSAEDELIALDTFRLADNALDVELARYRPGDTVSLLVSRLGELRRYEVRLGRAPADRWSLSVRPDATPEQRQRLAAWLGAPDE